MPAGASEACLASAPGRSWTASDWPDDAVAVVFDRNSGDFWLVPEITRRILLRLESSGPLARSGLIAGIAADAALRADAGEVGRVLDDLLDKGLVVPAPAQYAAG